MSDGTLLWGFCRTGSNPAADRCECGLYSQVAAEARVSTTVAKGTRLSRGKACQSKRSAEGKRSRRFVGEFKSEEELLRSLL